MSWLKAGQWVAASTLGHFDRFAADAVFISQGQVEACNRHNIRSEERVQKKSSNALSTKNFIFNVRFYYYQLLSVDRQT